MVQYLVVGVLVAGALVYTIWALMPAAVRRSAAGRVAKHAGSLGMGDERAGRLQATLEKTGSCSECAQCKGCSSVKSPGPAKKI